MTPAFTRIALRYIAGILLARGFIGSEDASFLTGNPDVQMIVEALIGVGAGLVSEGWYWAAKRYGWGT